MKINWYKGLLSPKSNWRQCLLHASAVFLTYGTFPTATHRTPPLNGWQSCIVLWKFRTQTSTHRFTKQTYWRYFARSQVMCLRWSSQLDVTNYCLVRATMQSRITAHQWRSEDEEGKTLDAHRKDPPKCHFVQHGSHIKKSGIELEVRWS